MHRLTALQLSKSPKKPFLSLNDDLEGEGTAWPWPSKDPLITSRYPTPTHPGRAITAPLVESLEDEPPTMPGGPPPRIDEPVTPPSLQPTAPRKPYSQTNTVASDMDGTVHAHTITPQNFHSYAEAVAPYLGAMLDTHLIATQADYQRMREGGFFRFPFATRTLYQASQVELLLPDGRFEGERSLDDFYLPGEVLQGLVDIMSQDSTLFFVLEVEEKRIVRAITNPRRSSTPGIDERRPSSLSSWPSSLEVSPSDATPSESQNIVSFAQREGWPCVSNESHEANWPSEEISVSFNSVPAAGTAEALTMAKGRIPSRSGYSFIRRKAE